MEPVTKLKLRHLYLNNLENLYAGKVDYSSGSKPREAAIKACNAALAGKIRLEGQAWFKALEEVGLNARSTMKEIASLPSGGWTDI